MFGKKRKTYVIGFSQLFLLCHIKRERLVLRELKINTTCILVFPTKVEVFGNVVNHFLYVLNEKRKPRNLVKQHLWKKTSPVRCELGTQTRIFGSNFGDECEHTSEEVIEGPIPSNLNR